MGRRALTEMQHRRLISRNPKLRPLQWVVQRRNPLVFVRGKVRHADHKTIALDGWHQVLMNTERSRWPCGTWRLLTDNFNRGRRTSVTAAHIYGVRGVGVSACLAVNQEVRVRVPSDTPVMRKGGPHRRADD